MKEYMVTEDMRVVNDEGSQNCNGQETLEGEVGMRCGILVRAAECGKKHHTLEFH